MKLDNLQERLKQYESRNKSIILEENEIDTNTNRKKAAAAAVEESDGASGKEVEEE